MHEELVGLLDWVDEYFYDAIPKTEIRVRLAVLVDRSDEASGDCCQ